MKHAQAPLMALHHEQRQIRTALALGRSLQERLEGLEEELRENRADIRTFLDALAPVTRTVVVA